MISLIKCGFVVVARVRTRTQPPPWLAMRFPKPNVVGQTPTLRPVETFAIGWFHHKCPRFVMKKDACRQATQSVAHDQLYGCQNAQSTCARAQSSLWFRSWCRKELIGSGWSCSKQWCVSHFLQQQWIFMFVLFKTVVCVIFVLQQCIFRFKSEKIGLTKKAWCFFVFPSAVCISIRLIDHPTNRSDQSRIVIFGWAPLAICILIRLIMSLTN